MYKREATFGRELYQEGREGEIVSFLINFDERKSVDALSQVSVL